MRVLIVPDKFKGSLTAHEAAQAIAHGWRKARPKDKLELLPMSDGGDGFGAVMSELIGATPIRVKTRDAAHRPCTARWWWHASSRTAVLDTAAVVGLAMLPAGRYHPFTLDTFGLGVVLKAALRRGAKRCLVGLGGSATNDAGFGLARSLGWEFLDHSGHSIERWTDLANVAQLREPVDRERFSELIIAVDVQNPLLGPRGATRIYGPQKGLKPADLPKAERALRRVADIVRRQCGTNLATIRGAGAAGGLGFGFLAFLGGRLVPGFELFAHEARLEPKIRRADLVITSEGQIDRSTLMGKGAGRVAALASKSRVPCLGLCGELGSGVNADRLFTRVQSLVDLTSRKKAIAKPGFWLSTMSKDAAANW